MVRADRPSWDCLERRSKTWRVNDCHLSVAGGGTAQQTAVTLKDNPGTYPAPGMFGPMYPAYGFYVWHARNVQFSDVAVCPAETRRPPYDRRGVRMWKPSYSMASRCPWVLHLPVSDDW